jgi:two-component system OmpR family sensor kinase
MVVKKPKDKFNKKISNLIQDIIFYQIFLLLAFGLISYFLSLMALIPMREAVARLDNFSKDLIHDINTPITSILLNIKLLKKDENFASNRYLERISQNVKDINSLNSNLTILLRENSLVLNKIDILKVTRNIVDTYQKEYQKIKFEIPNYEYFVRVNEDAFKQIISNLLSNAVKYSKPPTAVTYPTIKIYIKSDTLFVEDNGIGIKNPVSVFKRSYTEHEIGHGIGLDIVKRLCEAMDIDISVTSLKNKGSIFRLKFNNNIT